MTKKKETTTLRVDVTTTNTLSPDSSFNTPRVVRTWQFSNTASVIPKGEWAGYYSLVVDEAPLVGETLYVVGVIYTEHNHGDSTVESGELELVVAARTMDLAMVAARAIEDHLAWYKTWNGYSYSAIDKDQKAKYPKNYNDYNKGFRLFGEVKHPRWAMHSVEEICIIPVRIVPYIDKTLIKIRGNA